MTAIEQLVMNIMDLLAQYFYVNLGNDEIYNLLEDDIYSFIGDVEFDLQEL